MLAAVRMQSDTGETSMVCAAAEVISGLLASGAAFVSLPQGASSWQLWLCDLLHDALRDAPLELADMWGLCIRFAVNGLCSIGDYTSLGLLLAMVSSGAQQDMAKSNIVKHLKCVGHCLNELRVKGCHDLQPAYEFRLAAMQNLKATMTINSASVRREVANCTAVLCTMCEGGKISGDPVSCY